MQAPLYLLCQEQARIHLANGHNLTFEMLTRTGHIMQSSSPEDLMKVAPIRYMNRPQNGAEGYWQTGHNLQAYGFIC